MVIFELWGKLRWVVYYDNFDLIRNSKKFLYRCKESFEVDFGRYEIIFYIIVCWFFILVLIKLFFGEFLGGFLIFCYFLRIGDFCELWNWFWCSDGECFNFKDEEDFVSVFLNLGRERRGEFEGMLFGIWGGWWGLWIGFWVVFNS